MITYENYNLDNKRVMNDYLNLWLKFAEDIRDHHDFPIPKSNKADFFVMIKRRIKKFKYAKLFFIKDDDKYIGFILASINKNDSDKYIDDVYIDKEYRGKGIADKNMQLALKWLWKVSGTDAIFINAMPGTEKFYKRNGFAVLSISMAHKKSKSVWGGDY